MKAKSQTTTFGILILILSSLFILNQCVFKKNDSQKEIPGVAENQQFEIKKQEARLLVEITNINSEVLILCENIKKSRLSKELISAADKVQYNHHSISKNLNQIAAEKLISLPDSVFNSFYANSITAIDDFNSEIYVRKIVRVIEREMILFENLEQNSDDVDIKSLAVQSKAKLKLSIKQLQSTRTNTNIKLQNDEKHENNFSNSISNVDLNFYVCAN